MKRSKPLKWLFYISLFVLIYMVSYKVYLNLSAPDFDVLHGEQIERIYKRLKGKNSFKFAVVGNINNSVGIFEKRIIPMINALDFDFIISAGNAVSGGGEDKYRAIQGTLNKLDIPYLLTFGENEHQDFGSFRFYEHFGPYFFSFKTGKSRFIFLDSTGKTPWKWQIRWVNDLLSQDDSSYRFLFIGHPPLVPDRDILFDESEDYLQPLQFRQALLNVVKKHRIDMVFSANIPAYAEQMFHGSQVIATGGAGGFILNDQESFYHFIQVEVSESGRITHSLHRLDSGSNPLFNQLENLWFFIYSLFYVSYANFILLLCAILLVTIKLYNTVFVEKDYYPDYDIDPSPWLAKPMRIAMFTNNYLPFIGGVPISIERLRQGLEQNGNQALVVAPAYGSQVKDSKSILRVPSLPAIGRMQQFRIANIFLPRIFKGLKTFTPDIIHIHHPFWLGSLGLFYARRLKVPAVYTYHTRLEEYAHFVPLPGLLFRNFISHVLVRRFANKCDGIIVPTDSIEEYLRMVGVKKPIYVQPTGIEYQRFQQVEPQEIANLKKTLDIGEEKILISVSRLSNEKNIDFMIEAIAQVHQKTRIRFRFFLIGEGPQRERLQQRIAALGLENILTLTGAVKPEEMALWYRLGDVFLFSSKSETQGMVILEAMAAGLPVVAVRSSGIDDVLREGFNGFKTPQKQNLWCDRVQLLLEDDSTRKEMSENARRFSRNYSIGEFTKNVREIYATILATADKVRQK
jgi:glycosyltransferase involved in cell wall biosynthesis